MVGTHALRLDTSLELLVERLEVATGACVLATIVNTVGSTYRKAGARMLLEADGRLTGLLSGGCFEHDLREHADRMLATGVPHVVSYDARGDDDLVFGIGAGCEGAMRILLEPAARGSRATAALQAAAALLARDEPAVLAVVHAGVAGSLGTRFWCHRCSDPGEPELVAACRAAAANKTATVAQWQEAGVDCQAWVQFVAPSPRVLVCGAGPDVEPVVAQLHALRFQVTVVDHRAAYADPARFPGAQVSLGPAATVAERIPLERYFAAVVMSHHLASDAKYLTALSASPLPHIGLLGPRNRRDRLLADIGPVAAALLGGRLRGPVGLDIGAVTPEAIALAIVAEVHSLAAGRLQVPRERTIPSR